MHGAKSIGFQALWSAHFFRMSFAAARTPARHAEYCITPGLWGVLSSIAQRSGIDERFLWSGTENSCFVSPRSAETRANHYFVAEAIRSGSIPIRGRRVQGPE